MATETLWTTPILFRMGMTVQHEKGSKYTIVGLPDVYVIEETGEPAYAYKAADGRIFIRSQKKMEDGRFFEILPLAEDPVGLHTRLAIRELNDGPVRGTGAPKPSDRPVPQASELRFRTKSA